MAMKSTVIINLDLKINMGSTDGYHSNDTLEQIRTAFIKKAMIEVVNALPKGGIMSVSNPKYTIILEEE